MRMWVQMIWKKPVCQPVAPGNAVHAERKQNSWKSEKCVFRNRWSGWFVLLRHRTQMQWTCSSLPLFPPGCHESCTACHGPGQRECVSCSDPTALLRDGECVGECGTGFYSQAGACHGKKKKLPSLLVLWRQPANSCFQNSGLLFQVFLEGFVRTFMLLHEVVVRDGGISETSETVRCSLFELEPVLAESPWNPLGAPKQQVSSSKLRKQTIKYRIISPPFFH